MENFQQEATKWLKQRFQSGLEINLQQYYLSDLTLQRFFIARNNDISQAMEMWTNFVEWHVKERPDKISYSDVEQILKKELAFIIGKDKLKQAVIFVWPKNAGALTIDEVNKCLLYLVETATSISEQENQTKFTVIYERNGFNREHLNQDALDKTKLALKILQNYYPERLHAILCMHPNWVFKLGYNILKVFINKKTIEKIKVLGDEEHIYEYINRNDLPTYYKGPQNKELSFEGYGRQYSQISNVIGGSINSKQQKSHRNIQQFSSETLQPHFQNEMQYTMASAINLESELEYQTICNDSELFFQQDQQNAHTVDILKKQQQFNYEMQVMGPVQDSQGGCCSGNCQIF